MSSVESTRFKKHCAEKGSWFALVSNIPEQRENMKVIAVDCQKWSFIDHEPDNDEGKQHTHFLVRFNGSRTVQQVADRFEISPQYVQKVNKLTAFMRYMMHLDNPDKHQYNVDDISTNFEKEFSLASQGNAKTLDVNSLFSLFQKVRNGQLSPSDFIQYNYIEFSKMSFSQKIKTFETLCKVANTTT